MLKRYKAQHAEEYNKSFINENFKKWSDFEVNERENLLMRLQEDGWLTWSFYLTRGDTEKNKYLFIVMALLTLKKNYINFPVQLPNIVDAKKLQLEKQVRLALHHIFTQAEDFIFYDFITIYENTALAKDRQLYFVADLENYFQQLGVNMTFTSDEIIPRQSSEIQEKIIEPTLRLLQSDSYLQINNELSEGFDAYKRGNHGEFILCTINALVSTLEYISYGKITQEKNKFNNMIAKLNSENIITKKIQNLLKAINSYAEIERREKTKAHISQLKATDQESLFIFNLSMTVIQFLILSKSK